MGSTVDAIIVPPLAPDFLGKVDLNLSLGLVTSCFSLGYGCILKTCMLLAVGDGPCALLTPLKVIRVGVGVIQNKHLPIKTQWLIQIMPLLASF